MIPIQLSSPPVTKSQDRGININVSLDTVLFAIFVLWIIWKRAIQPSFAEQIGSLLIPVEEERKLNTLLAQIGVITNASRVILGAFHNGAVDSEGYHLQRFSSINSYIREGCTPMSVQIKNLSIIKLVNELDMMEKVPDWHEVRYRDDLPEACKAHMNNNNIACMYNRLVKIGNLPIGILSLQYVRDYDFELEDGTITRHSYEGLLEDLFTQVTAIMRRRIVHPSPIKKVSNRIMGLLKV